MFGLFKSSQPKLLRIDGLDTPIEVGKKETILSAALRQGVRFPHSCRVGGCASCKCQLTSGKVKELTESAYVLSEQELDQGYVLACQSVPKSDVSIKVDGLNASTPQIKPQSCNGTVINQRRLTHDIVALDIRLDQTMHYSAGQYALLSVPGQLDEARSYSFASAAPSSGLSTVTFFIRQVPGGEMSGWAQGDVVNTAVTVAGPFGDFYLRESGQPILCVAGGSGLAPVKALLEDALQFKNPRPVVFLFGARTRADLYCLDDIQRLQQEWNGDFLFVPVLSEAADDHWQGARGLVTELLPQYASPIAQAYMCGPPAMLEAAESSLQQLGMPADQIFSDKFLDKSNQLKTA